MRAAANEREDGTESRAVKATGSVPSVAQGAAVVQGAAMVQGAATVQGAAGVEDDESDVVRASTCSEGVVAATLPEIVANANLTRLSRRRPVFRFLREAESTEGGMQRLKAMTLQ